MASSAVDTALQSDVADVTEPKIIKIMRRNKLGLYKQISLRVSVVRVPLQPTTGNLKAQDAVPLLTSTQQLTSPAPTTSYGPGSTDNRPAQHPAQLSTSTSGLPVVEIAPEENTINVSSTVDVSNTDPPPLASAIVDGANLVNAINTQVNAWTTLLDNVNFVAQILDKISQIHLYASLACGVLSVIPKTIAQQIERDANVKGLVDDLNNGFKTLREAEDLEKRCSDSAQAEIISRIFQQTSECGSFIERYFKNSSFWKRLVLNIASGPDQIVEQYRTALVGLRKDFLERTT
ncbi:hypothetical protein K488DRAFT_91281, partial [Vararia minispora EC-137]